MYQTTREKINLDNLFSSKTAKPINSYTVADIVAARAVLQRLLAEPSANEVSSVRPVIAINNEA